MLFFIPSFKEKVSLLRTRTASVLSSLKTSRRAHLGIFIAAALIIVFAVCSLSGGVKDIDYTKHPLVYTKNGELYLRSYGEKESYKLSSNVNGDIHLSENGELLYYCDNYNDGTFDLYFRKTSDTTSKGTKISDGVTGYQILDSGSKALYLKDSGLYLSDTRESYPVASNVTAYRFSKNNDNILYIANDSLYVRGLGKNDAAALICADAEALFNRDSKNLYFKKGGALYFSDNGAAPAKVLDDIHTVFSPKEDVYFAVTRTKAEDGSVSYAVYTLDGSNCREAATELSEAPNSKRVLTKATENGAEIMILKLDGSVVAIDKTADNSSNITVSYDDKYVYLIDELDANGKGSLKRFKLTNKGLRSPKLICQNAVSVAVHGKKDEIITVTGDGFGVYSGGSYRRVSQGEVRLMYVSPDTEAVYFVDELKGDSGTLKRVKNGKVTKLDSNVSDFVFRGKNCYYVKDSNLYYKKGSRSEKLVDTAIDSIIYKYI